jgi:hypothetical protein
MKNGLSEYLIEAVAKRTSGKYNGREKVKRYSEMNFNELCLDLFGRDYYYEMSGSEGDDFVWLMENKSYREAWKYLLTEVGGGTGLWYGDKKTKTIWIVTVSLHSACVDKIEYSILNKIDSLSTISIPLPAKEHVLSGSNIEKAKEHLDLLLEQ